MKSGKDIFEESNNSRKVKLDRKIAQAAAVMPSILPDECTTEHQGLSNGDSSVPAMAANTLANKLMLALFSPGQPFIKLELKPKVMDALMEQLGLQDSSIITDVLSKGERQGLKYLEASGSRPLLLEALLHLIVVGDVLMDMQGDSLVFHALTNYTVDRSPKGNVTRVCLKEMYTLADLEKAAREEYEKALPNPNRKPTDKVGLYTISCLKDGMMVTDKWVDDVKLSGKFSSRLKPENAELVPLTWRLPLRQAYGVSRVEECINDILRHDDLSRNLGDGAALASQFRWLCDPMGSTRPEDFAGGENGGVLPGTPNDVSLAFANIGQQLNTILGIEQEYARRINRAFMAVTSVTRDAERVTAEEIRILATELDTSLGGAYTRLGQDMQTPLAKWLMKRVDLAVQGTQVEATAITGMDALSRNADLERLKLFLGDVASLDGISPNTRMKLQEPAIISEMAAGRGVDRGKFVASEAEVQAREQAMLQQQVNQQAALIGAEAAATNEVQQ